MAMKLYFQCVHCRTNVKVHSLATALAILIVGLGILLPYVYFGFARELAFFGVVSLLLYFFIMWFAPIQVDSDENNLS